MLSLQAMYAYATVCLRESASPPDHTSKLSSELRAVFTTVKGPDRDFHALLSAATGRGTSVDHINYGI